MMILVVCIEERRGMLFHGRRLSKDRVVRQDLLRQAEHTQLWMNAYTAKQFDGIENSKIRVFEDCLQEAGTGEYCFVENQEIDSVLPKAEGMILYHWNRRYPADRYLPVLPDTWKLISQEEFGGHSHEKITKEIYQNA